MANIVTAPDEGRVKEFMFTLSAGGCESPGYFIHRPLSAVYETGNAADKPDEVINGLQQIARSLRAGVLRDGLQKHSPFHLDHTRKTG